MAVRSPAANASKIERGLEAVMGRHNERSKALEEAVAERDRLIRDAIEAKLPLKRIAELTGLSVQRLDQIRRGSRI